MSTAIYTVIKSVVTSAIKTLPIGPWDGGALLLEDNASYLLLEDGTSKLLLG